MIASLANSSKKNVYLHHNKHQKLKTVLLLVILQNYILILKKRSNKYFQFSNIYDMKHISMIIFFKLDNLQLTFGRKHTKVYLINNNKVLR